MEKGKLYIVSTPIGNLEDITLRAIRILNEVSYIIAEDTREAGKLIQLLNLPKKSFISYRDQNHDRALSQVISLLDLGNNLALVSDRGTPLISDPGYKLVRDLLNTGYEVVSVPGPTSAIAALTVSGLPSDRFVFLGFLPRTAGKQKKLLQKYSDGVTFIIFESPFRVLKTLQNIYTELGNIDIALVSEITKTHEKVIRGKASGVLKNLENQKLKGEWVILGRKDS